MSACGLKRSRLKAPYTPDVVRTVSGPGPADRICAQLVAFGAHLLPCNRPHLIRVCEDDEVCPSRPPSFKPWDRGYGLRLQAEGLLVAASLALQGQALGRATLVAETQRKAATNIADG